MRTLLTDVRHALRGLRAQPLFAITAILTLALGIGVTTAIFGVVDGIVLRPLPYPNAERLVTLCEQHPGGDADWCSVSPPNVEDIAARSRTIEAIGIARSWPYQLTTVGGKEGINGGLASPGLFRALGVRPELGRLIEPSDLIGRESMVVLLTHEFWQARFGGARDVIGRTMVLDDRPVTIVGVLPAGLTALPPYERLQLWRPLHIDPRDEQHRTWAGFVAYGRLREGVSERAARADLARIVEQLRAEHFAKTPGWGIGMKSLQDLVVGGVRPALLLFLGAVFLVLLIACANVANLMLARAAGRGREMALRAALGAGRGRIVRALLVESFVLALIGAVLGSGLAVWGTDAFRKLAPPNIPRVEDVRMDGRVLAFALALAVATTFVFGLVPAIRAARVDLAQALREGGRSASGRRSRLGALLVTGELALALMLTSGAGLLTRSFAALAGWSPGFEREHLLTFTLFASGEKYASRTARATLLDRVEGELRAVPGVVAAGSASGGPLFGGREASEVRLPGSTEERGLSVAWFDVSPGFFHVLGVPIVLGRDFDRRDGVGAPTVGLVNQSAARRFWPGASPIGKRLSLFEGRMQVEVVGVVRDVPPLDPLAPVEPQLYWPNRQEPRGFTFFVVRTAVPPASVAATIHARLKTIDPDLDAKSFQSMPELLDRKLTTPRFQMLLLLSFGLSALVLAAVGTYGLFAYVVSRRTRELGIRIALGAAQSRIIGDVLREGLVLAGAGIVVGALASLALGRAMRGLAVGVQATDPLTIAASALVLVVVALTACLVPARRAGRVDPVVTLSAE